MVAVAKVMAQCIRLFVILVGAFYAPVPIIYSRKITEMIGRLGTDSMQ